MVGFNSILNIVEKVNELDAKSVKRTRCSLEKRKCEK